MNSLTGNLGEGTVSPHDSGTPTQADHTTTYEQQQPPATTAPANGYHQPVVSTFSTSSKDLDPYPTQQLGIQAGQPPPQVVHYHGQRGGSQANTPTLSSHQETGAMRRGSQDPGTKTNDPQFTPVVEIVEDKTADRSSTPKVVTSADEPGNEKAVGEDR
ncbi:hypothetical protein HYQ46_012465 [Verticillium longisporum]|nr:hypothetical protein HYQ46_012465 [Verticillium longisporum]